MVDTFKSCRPSLTYWLPTYDPGAIYSRRVYNGSSFGGFFSFGSGFAIGAWLNYDGLDWVPRRAVTSNWRVEAGVSSRQYKGQ